MKQLTILYIILFSIFFQCKEKDWRDEIPKPNWQTLHSNLASKRKFDFQLKGGRNSKEAVIQDWFSAIKKNSKQEDWTEYVLSDAEYFDYFAPHTLGSGTALDSTELEQYKANFLLRKEIGLKHIIDIISQTDGKISNIEWRPEQKTYGPFTGFKPEKIFIKSGKENVKLESIKQIVHYKGQWKIAVLAP